MLAQFYDLYIFVRFESGYRVGLVGFYADNNLLNAQRFGEKSCPARYFVRLFNHKTVVAGKIGFAFRAVYYQRVNGRFRRNLNRRGEARAAKPYYSAIAYARPYFVCRRLGKRGEGKLFAVFLRVYNYKRFVSAVYALFLPYFGNRARNA